MGEIFKAYDIRGIYGRDLTDDLAEAIGRAFATFLGCRRVVVGRDMRPHSEPLFHALARGLTRQGADVLDLGLCSTPMSYFANGRLEADGGIMITASHNTGEWNGFKLCRGQAIPLSGETGIQDLRRIVGTGAFAPAPERSGRIEPHDIAGDYTRHIRSFADLGRPVRAAVDFANAMGIVEHRALEGLVETDPLFDALDGSFPNHEANPLKAETYRALQAKVRSGGYDLGMAYDGDAVRVGFTDERGEIVPMDLMTALIARMVLRRAPGAAIYYDLRSSRSVPEVIEESGGRPLQSRVGHAFIKQQMRDADAAFAGELSGHYYFRENYYTESSSLAALHVCNLVSRADRPLSELVRPLRRYHASGEINSRVADPPAALARLKERYGDGRLLELDGLSVEFDDWWFNVRTSNTEPLVRLNLEARDAALMARRRDEVLALIRA